MENKVKLIVFIIASVILATVFITVFLKFNRDLSASNKRINDIKSQIYKSKYCYVEYLLDGNGPTILISHGVTGGIDQGIGMSALFFGKGYKFLYVSRFGYLKSSMPDIPSAKLQAEVYKDLLDFLGIDNVIIMGNSAGGTSAIHFAIDYPDKCKGLILISSVVPGNLKKLPPKFFMDSVFGSDFLYWVTVKSFGESMMKMFVPESIIKKKSKQERRILINDIFLAGFPISNRTKGVLFDTYISNPSIDEVIPFENIKLPVLIIHAIDDPAPPVEGARTISGKIPNCKLVIYETGGHLILNHENEIKETIRNFVFR
jgi:pimeloyl-ACP methyl ester carboxylesterase